MTADAGYPYTGTKIRFAKVFMARAAIMATSINIIIQPFSYQFYCLIFPVIIPFLHNHKVVG